MTRLTRLLCSPLLPVPAVCGTGLFCTPAARAESPACKASDFASGAGNILSLGAALWLPLLSDGKDGRDHALRAAAAIGTSVLFAEGLKELVRKKRPDANTHDSFPSGHATAAFAAATVEIGLHPKQAPLWYLGAALILSPLISPDSHSYGLQVGSAWL